MSNEYQHVSKSKLMLKNESEIKTKKSKKHKKKDKEKLIRAVIEEPPRTEKDQQAAHASTGKTRVLTKAEESFKKMQEKMQNKRIVQKAQMTHKQRVEQFNQHLDSLTEHFDIPKVSWTK